MKVWCINALMIVLQSKKDIIQHCSGVKSAHSSCRAREKNIKCDYVWQSCAETTLYKVWGPYLKAFHDPAEVQVLMLGIQRDLADLIWLPDEVHTPGCLVKRPPDLVGICRIHCNLLQLHERALACWPEGDRALISLCIAE